MRLCTILVHNNCTPIYQPDPDTSLLNTLKNQSDKVRLIAKMTDQGLYTILVKAVRLVRNDPTYGPRLSNCWLPAATWVEALQKTGHIDASLSIDVRKFNTAMPRAPLYGSVMSWLDGSNNSGVFLC
jgi:hypothetical protein